MSDENVDAERISTLDPLRITSMSMTIKRDGGDIALLDSIDLRVGPGEVVGLVGESGSGKSLTSRSTLGLFPTAASTSGSIRVDGFEVVGAQAPALRELRRARASMIFQDPRASVNPVRRVGDFVTEGLRAQGVSAANAREAGIRLLEAVGIRSPKEAMRRYPHEFSGGMLQRIVIAGALSTKPRLILADEATTALDVTTQAEVVALLKTLQRETGAGLLFVTHDLDLAAALCDRVYVMYAGRIVESGFAEDIFARPRHPYTAGLLSSSPRLTGERIPPVPISGRPRALSESPTGCAFRDRCRLAVAECADIVPPFVTIGRSEVACVRAGEEEVVAS